MKFSRKNFLLMAGATSLIAMGAETLSAKDGKLAIPDLETELQKVLGLPGIILESNRIKHNLKIYGPSPLTEFLKLNFDSIRLK